MVGSQGRKGRKKGRGSFAFLNVGVYERNLAIQKCKRVCKIKSGTLFWTTVYNDISHGGAKQLRTFIFLQKNSLKIGTKMVIDIINLSR